MSMASEIEDSFIFGTKGYRNTISQAYRLVDIHSIDQMAVETASFLSYLLVFVRLTTASDSNDLG